MTPNPQAAAQLAPAQIAPAFLTKIVVLGSYRLDEQSLRQLTMLVKDGTSVVQPAIDATVKGRTFVHLGVDNLLQDPSVPAVVHDLTIAANEQAVGVGTKTVIVTFTKQGPNTLFVSSFDRVWVEGKAAQIESFLQNHESKVAHILRNYGGSLNSLIFLIMLGVLPSIPSLVNRFNILGSVFILLFALLYSWKLAVGFKGFLRLPKLAWYEKHEGWLLVLFHVTLAAWIGYLITRYLGIQPFHH